MKIIITRHTNTEWNTLGKMQGQTDIPLSDLGKHEAKELTEKLVPLGITKIISSDLKRAYETAEIINTTLLVTLEKNPALRECSFGILEGLTQQQAIEMYGSSLLLDLEDNNFSYNFKNFGGENRNEVLARHIKVIESIAKDNPNDIYLLVGHSKGMSTLLIELGYLPSIEQSGYRVVEFKT